MPFLSDLIEQVYAELASRMTADEPIGLTTGLPLVDEAIGGGLIRQQLSYLVGDSGVGKSWLASSFVLRGAQALMNDATSRPASGYILTGTAVSDTQRQVIADKVDKPPVVVFWSLEMAELPITTRMLAQLAHETADVHIDSGLLLRGDLGEDKGTPEWEERLQVFRDLYQQVKQGYGKYVFLEFEARDVLALEDTLDELATLYDVVLVVVDYFRLIEETAYDGSMATLQAERSKKLRDLARYYDCHVLSLFDINREGQKAGKVAAVHMRGGVAANYDADLVLVLNREHAEKDENNSEAHLVLRVGKGRFVQQSRVDLRADLATGYIEPWDQRITPWTEDV